MSAKQMKKYQPPRRINPEVLAKRIDKLDSEVKRQKNLIDAINKANSLHVEHLSNFVRHDMKNAIIGLDGTIFNAHNTGQIPDELYEQLSTCMDLLRGSLDGFTRLIPSASQRETTLPEILNAVEMLSRGSLQMSRVESEFQYDRSSSKMICIAFQSIVQVVHNMIINAVNSMYETTQKRLLVTGCIDGERCEIKIYDNGCEIPEAIRDKIYEYGFSTTNGSGIGLFHAKNIMDEVNGSITHKDSDIAGFTKYFHITFNMQCHE